MPWVPRPNAGPDEFDWVDEDPFLDPYAPAPTTAPTAPVPQTPPAAPPPPAPTPGRNPNAGPPGSTYPNMDPPGYRGGYWGDDGQWVQGSPYMGGGGGGNTIEWDLFGGAPPTPVYPDYISAGAFRPRTDTFALDPYAASSWADAENEPGYQSSREQLRKQIEAGAAHRGMLRSGMTIGDLYSNLDALSQQNFRQFDDRRYRNWSGNQQQRLEKFDREYGVDRDVYDRLAADITGRNNYQFNVADAAARDALDRWKTRVSALTSLARPVE